MSNELHDSLCEYLGGLLHKLDNTFDWIEKEKVIIKVNACYVLLGIEKKEITFMEAAQQAMKPNK